MKIQERVGGGNNRASAPAQPGAGERLPTPPRERKPALAALAVLLILVGALGATVLVLRAGDRISAIKIEKEIPVGAAVTDDAVTEVLVAADESVHYVEWSQLASLKKLKAKYTIPKGAVAVGEMFAEGTGLPEGKVNVGLSLKEGQYPSGLKPGDTVTAYRVGDAAAKSRNDGAETGSGSAAGAPLVESAQIALVREAEEGSVSSGTLPVTVTVDKAVAGPLAQAAKAGEVALVRLPAGGAAGGTSDGN
ncbi:membrane protein [Streptomyces sp. NRRL F-6602]|nr:membrane protein [Streptomyces sp. NRRL F-6602]